MKVWMILLIVSLIITAIDLVLAMAMAVILSRRYLKEYGKPKKRTLAEHIISIIKIIVFSFVPVLNVITLIPLIMYSQEAMERAYELMIENEAFREKYDL